MSRIQPLVMDILESVDCGTSSNILEVGKRFRYQDNNTGPGVVEITGGQYMGVHGISNHWSWRRVDEGGRLTGPEIHGYNNGVYGRQFSPLDSQPDNV